MIEALKHPHENVRVDVALALFKVGDERAIEALKKTSSEDENEVVRFRADRALQLIAIHQQSK